MTFRDEGIDEEDDEQYGPFHDGRLHVQLERCETCIFHPGNQMMLNEGTVKDMVDACLAEPSGGGNIPCHDTLGGYKAICRGFWDAYSERIQLLTVAKRLSLVVYVNRSDKRDWAKGQRDER